MSDHRIFGASSHRLKIGCRRDSVAWNGSSATHKRAGRPQRGDLIPFYLPVLMRVVCCIDRTWVGRSEAGSNASSYANSAGVWYPIALCNRSWFQYRWNSAPRTLTSEGEPKTSRSINTAFIRLLNDSLYPCASQRPRHSPVALTRMLLRQLMQTLANLPLFIIDPCFVRCVDRDCLTNRQAIRSNADMQISWPTTGIHARRHMCSDLEHLGASIRSNQTVSWWLQIHL